MTDLERLAAMTATELSGMFADQESLPADMRAGDWLAAVQLLTARLTEEAESLSGQELNRGAAALDTALDRAEQAGDIDKNEGAIRRLNLASALIRLRGPDPDVVFLNPQRMYDLFTEATPLSTAQLRELPADWRTLDIADIRRLRVVKNLLAPLVGVAPIMAQAGFAEEVGVWEETLPLLP